MGAGPADETPPVAATDTPDPPPEPTRPPEPPVAEARPEPTPPEPQPPPTVAQTVRVQIGTRPANAELFLDGEPIANRDGLGSEH